jgi:hypothetical protein
MHRIYVIAAMLSLGLFSYAQNQGWSLFDSDEGVEKGRASSLSSRHK